MGTAGPAAAGSGCCRRERPSVPGHQNDQALTIQHGEGAAAGQAAWCGTNDPVCGTRRPLRDSAYKRRRRSFDPTLSAFSRARTNELNRSLRSLAPGVAVSEQNYLRVQVFEPGE